MKFTVEFGEICEVPTYDTEDALVTKTLTEYRNDRVTTIASGVFASAAKLVSVEFPRVKSMWQAFQGCSALQRAYFPECTSIGNNAFQNCPKLVDVYIPKATEIPPYAFQLCSSLEHIELPAVKAIGPWGFMNCTKLTAIVLPLETVCTLNATSPCDNTPIANGTGYIYVPRALVESYKVATNWSTYAAQIRAIEDWPDITGG